MCSPEEMPHDVVTMNSRVKFRNLSDGEVRVRTLVYPAKMTDSNTQLSVMAPVGAALLGLRVGDSIHWEIPGGVATHLEVLKSNAARSCWRLPALIPSAQAITRFAQRMHSHPLYAKSAIFPGSHCSLLLQNYSVSVCGNNHGRSILHPDRISDYGGDYRHGCPLPRKPLLTIILLPASHSPDLKPPSAPPLRFVHRVPESPYGTPLHVFRKSHIPGRPLQTAYSG